MERYFWVKWKDSKRCEHVVGILSHTNDKYYFKYNPEFKEEKNVPPGFNSVPSFGRITGLSDSEKEKVFSVRSSNNLFDFFKMRIVRESEEKIWKNYGLDEYDECNLLAVTKGKMSTDSFFVEPMDLEAVKDVKESEDFSYDR